MILLGDFTVRGKGIVHLKKELQKDKKYKRLIWRNHRHQQRRLKNGKVWRV